MKILLIEDDEEFANLIADFLNSRGIECEVCIDPFRALVTSLKDYDLILLDLGLPGLDGLEVCKDIRSKSKIPIIISSARSSVSDKVLGLGLGADDYLPKPYDPDELYARISSLIRRSKDEFNEDKEDDFAFMTDENSRDVKFLGNYLRLTEAEYQVCKTLIRYKNSIVSKEQLQGECTSISTNDGKSLEVVISKIRHKIKPYSQKNHIFASRGRGYRIV